MPGGTRESSGRSRGFKFTLVAAVGAFLSSASRIIMPESMQGALGPVLVAVNQPYDDFRNHPKFTTLMSRFLKALLGRELRYEFPRLWYTKGETLRAYADRSGGRDFWSDTQSCWQQSRQVSWHGKRRQCGICAACLLRRMSMHAAGLSEARETFIWQDLSASKFHDGIAPGFDNVTDALREYAIAGVLFLDHLAALATEPVHEESLEYHTFELSRSLGLSEADTADRLVRVLYQHKTEWKNFMDSVGHDSFLADWARTTR